MSAFLGLVILHFYAFYYLLLPMLSFEPELLSITRRQNPLFPAMSQSKHTVENIQVSDIELTSNISHASCCEVTCHILFSDLCIQFPPMGVSVRPCCQYLSFLFKCGLEGLVVLVQKLCCVCTSSRPQRCFSEPQMDRFHSKTVLLYI